MSAELARRWIAMVTGAVVLSTGCVTMTPSSERDALATGSNAPERRIHRRGERVQVTKVAMVGPAELAVRTVAGSAVRVDAFEYLLLLAGLDNVNDLPTRSTPLTAQEAARVLTALLNKPVTLGSFPPRMAVRAPNKNKV